LTIAVVLIVATLWRKHQDLLLGVAIGLAIHFFRDLGEPGSGVSLLWPFSYHSFSLPHAAYLVAMAAVVAFDWWFSTRLYSRALDTASIRDSTRCPPSPTQDIPQTAP
jgi:membrane-bound metal-dependent hydrolase YbcI (DUF457 family)